MTAEPSGSTRRSLLAAAAWTTPAIALASAAPAKATSDDSPVRSEPLLVTVGPARQVGAWDWDIDVVFVNDSTATTYEGTVSASLPVAGTLVARGPHAVCTYVGQGKTGARFAPVGPGGVRVVTVTVCVPHVTPRPTYPTALAPFVVKIFTKHRPVGGSPLSTTAQLTITSAEPPAWYF